MPIVIANKVIQTFARISPLGSSFTTAATQMVQHNDRRIGLFIENPSPATFYLSHNADITTLNGIILAANGGSYSLNFQEDGELCTLPVFGITDSGTRTIFVMETVLSIGWDEVERIVNAGGGR